MLGTNWTSGKHEGAQFSNKRRMRFEELIQAVTQMCATANTEKVLREIPKLFLEVGNGQEGTKEIVVPQGKRD